MTASSTAPYKTRAPSDALKTGKEKEPCAAPFRIALILPRFSRYGGVEQFGYRLAELLALRGHSVDFLCARQEENAPKGVIIRAVGRPPGFKVVRLLWFLLQTERLRKKGRYDLVLSLGKTWRQDITRMGGGPLAVFWEKSVRALPEGLPRKLKSLRRRLSLHNLLVRLVEKHQFTEKSEVIAVSHLVRGWLLQAHPRLAPERVHIIYNRPDLGRFSPPGPEERAALRTRLVQDTCREGSKQTRMDKARAVFIGTASTNFQLKGVRPLIMALAQLPENTFLFVAGGRRSAAYRTLVRSLGLEGRVFFCGRVDDMPAFYRALDIFILPTFYDACSNAVLEALASGCKTLTSAANGAAFFLEKEAVLPNPDDIVDMAKRLQQAIKLPPPAAFIWPAEVKSGLDAFVKHLEAKLNAGQPGDCPASAEQHR